MGFDAYIKIGSIPGESTDSKHKDWIELLSFSWGASQPASVASATGGRSAERVNVQDFSIVKVLDKSSPILALRVCDGQHIDKAVVELCEAAGDKHVYMKYTMENVIISSVRPGGSSQGGESKPMEEVSLNFGKITWEYTPVDSLGHPLGKQVAGWNLETNVKI